MPPHFIKKMGTGPWRPMPTENPWVLLYGPTGCGKTHLAVEMIVGRAGARFVAWNDVVEQRRRHIMATRTFEDPLEHIKNLRGILVVDDLGAEFVTDVSKEAADLLISARYNNEAPTILTSNLTLKQLASVYGDRLGSRIAGSARIIELAEKSDRRRRQAARAREADLGASAGTEAASA